MTAPAPHVPVLIDAVIAGLDPQAGETHVDGTFGAGGYTRAILRTGARVIAFDRDPDAIVAGRAIEAENDGALPGFDRSGCDAKELPSPPQRPMRLKSARKYGHSGNHRVVLRARPVDELVWS